MPKTFVFLIIGLFFGTGFGFLLAASNVAPPHAHTNAPGTVHDHAAHDHGVAARPGAAALTEAAAPAPTLRLTLHPDGAQSRNLHIAVTNFTFAPATMNGPHVPGQGHAHIYIDGVKIARVYAPWFHLSALPVGHHDIRVTLNANDHSQLAVQGQPIEATTTLEIK